MKKKCNACLVVKPLIDFHKAIWGRDGLNTKCKKCCTDKIPVPKKVTIEGLKQCTVCKVHKEFDEFTKDKHAKDNLKSKCASCCSSLGKQRRIAPKVVLSGSKNCSFCNEIKILSNFNRNNTNKDGYSTKCRACTSLYRLQTIARPKIELSHKICNICSVNIDITGYNKSIDTTSGFSNTCRNCINAKNKLKYLVDGDRIKAATYSWRDNNYEKVKEYNRISRIKNIEKLREKSKISRLNNKEKIAESNRKWRLENAETLKISKKLYSQDNKHVANRWRKKKIKEDFLFRISSRFKSKLSTSFTKLTKGTYTKPEKSIVILGCSFDRLLSHLTSQFVSWMSTDNYGNCESREPKCTWHIDHIIPTSYATTEEDLCLLNHWSNLQPLCSIVNLSKNAKVYPCTNLELGITFWEDSYEKLNF